LRESKNPPFLSVPLNANELLLPAKRAELQELVSFYLHFMFKQESDKDGETQEEVTTCRMQLDISEWLVDSFMSLMWS